MDQSNTSLVKSDAITAGPTKKSAEQIQHSYNPGFDDSAPPPSSPRPRIRTNSSGEGNSSSGGADYPFNTSCKPFKCNVCGKAFQQAVGFSRHMGTNHRLERLARDRLKRHLVFLAID